MAVLFRLIDSMSWLHLSDSPLVDLHLLFIPLFVQQLADSRLRPVHFLK